MDFDNTERSSPSGYSPSNSVSSEIFTSSITPSSGGGGGEDSGSGVKCYQCDTSSDGTKCVDNIGSWTKQTCVTGQLCMVSTSSINNHLADYYHIWYK